MTLTDPQATAIRSLRRAFLLTQEADVATDGRWQGLLGPVMDLLANISDVIEDSPEPVGR